MPVTIGRARKSGLAKTTVRIPRKRIPGQPGLEPVNAPLTARERRVAQAFTEALTFPPEVVRDFLVSDDVSYASGSGLQTGTDLYPFRADGPLTPLIEHLEPARQILSANLQGQINESGSLFWNELTDKLKRSPDRSAVNRIEKDVSPKPVTVIPPEGASFSVGFSSGTPVGKRWAENESARLITNIAEDTRANLQDVIGGTTGGGGRQAMMNMLGEVLETAPTMGDLAEFGERLAPSVAGLTLPQHNAVLNRGRTVFAEAMAAGKTTEQALQAVETEATKYGKKLRQQRTRVISRTEMMEAANRGKLEAAQQAADAGMFNPARAGKMWITSSFDVCSVCEPLHGKVVAFEGATFDPVYQRGGDWVVEPRELPPAHPNCRCTWTVVYDTIVPPSTGLPGQVVAPPDVPAAVRNQAWTKAAQIRKKIVGVESGITDSVVDAASDLGAEMYGLEWRIKDEASLARKIATDFVDQSLKFPDQTVAQVGDKIGDSLRYTMVFDDADYVDGVSRAVRDLTERGYELAKPPKNYWSVPNDELPYNGINMNWRAPDGTLVEIQFHTEAGLETKQLIHPLYEKQRQIGLDSIEFERLRLLMQKTADTLDYPRDVTDLRYFVEEPGNPFRLQTDDDLYNRFGGRLPEGTEDAYVTIDPKTGKRRWWQMRDELHTEITDSIIGDVPIAEPGEQVVHFMGGGPASGKGNLIREGLADVDRSTMVVVDADEIKDFLPEYQVLRKERATRAAAYVHEESSELSKRVFAESVESGRNTVLDGTGDSSIEKLRAKVSAAREASDDAKVVADYVTVDLEEAVTRARRRGQRTGRFVPEEVVRETHTNISKIFPDILDENLFDDIKLWDTNVQPPRMILRKVDGVLEVYDEKAYAKFLRKADYDIDPFIDTQARFTEVIENRRVWTEARQAAVHDPYVADALAEGVAVADNDVVILGGGPASGKSRVTRSAQVDLPDSHVLVNADEAKEAIPEFVQIIDQGGEYAASYVHEESSYMSKRLMSEALEESKPVVLDGTGDSSYTKLTAKVTEAREKAGGRVVGEYVTVDIDEAVERAYQRGLRDGRFVPEEVLVETHESVSAVFPRAASDDLFDELRLWDTNAGGEPVLVYEKIAGQAEVVHRPDLYERFLRKNPGYEPPPATFVPTEAPITVGVLEIEPPLPSARILEEVNIPERIPVFEPSRSEIAAIIDEWDEFGLEAQEFLVDAHIDNTIRRAMYEIVDESPVTRLTMPDLPEGASATMIEARAQQEVVNTLAKAYYGHRAFSDPYGISLMRVLEPDGLDIMKINTKRGRKWKPLGRVINDDGWTAPDLVGISDPKAPVPFGVFLRRFKPFVERGEILDPDSLKPILARLEVETSNLGMLVRREIEDRGIGLTSADITDSAFFRMAATSTEQKKEAAQLFHAEYTRVSADLGWDFQQQIFVGHEPAVVRALDHIAMRFNERVYGYVGLDSPMIPWDPAIAGSGGGGTPMGMIYKTTDDLVEQFRLGAITEDEFVEIIDRLGDDLRDVAYEFREEAVAAAKKGKGSRSESGLELLDRLFDEETGVLYSVTPNNEDIYRAAERAVNAQQMNSGRLNEIVVNGEIATATVPTRAARTQQVFSELRQVGEEKAVFAFNEVSGMATPSDVVGGMALPDTFRIQGEGSEMWSLNADSPLAIKTNETFDRMSAQWIPDDWLRRSDEYGKLGLGIGPGKTGAPGMSQRAAYWQVGEMDYPTSGGNGIIDITERGSSDSTLFHEFTHRDQYVNVVHADLDSQFARRRISTGDPLDDRYQPLPLNDILGEAGYGDDEIAVVDEFINAYLGKVNPKGGRLLPRTHADLVADPNMEWLDDAQFIEVSTVGVQEIAYGKEASHIFDNDPDYADYILGLLTSG